METTENVKKETSLTIPIAIVVAGAVIAGAVYFSNKDRSAPTPVAKENTQGEIAIDPVTDRDHILGNPQAEIVVVEYSDTECPFCKTFHPTMERIIDEYGKDGKVAWVYRHFPLDSIHPKADKEAEATECAAELGGDAKFWEYIGIVFDITPSNNNLDLKKLPEIAEQVGLDRKKFEECLASGKYAEKVESQFQSGIKAGAQGTPYSIAITKSGKYPINGAQPYTVVKQIIEAALSEK